MYYEKQHSPFRLRGNGLKWLSASKQEEQVPAKSEIRRESIASTPSNAANQIDQCPLSLALPITSSSFHLPSSYLFLAILALHHVSYRLCHRKPWLSHLHFHVQDERGYTDSELFPLTFLVIRDLPWHVHLPHRWSQEEYCSDVASENHRQHLVLTWLYCILCNKAGSCPTPFQNHRYVVQLYAQSLEHLSHEDFRNMISSGQYYRLMAILHHHSLHSPLAQHDWLYYLLNLYIAPTLRVVSLLMASWFIGVLCIRVLRLQHKQNHL